MQMLYNSDSFAVVSFDVPADEGEGALTRLYEQRQALYLELADVCVEAEDADAAAAQIEADYRAFIR